MAGLSSYPAADTLTGTEEMVADQSGSTVNVTPAQIAEYAQSIGLLTGWTSVSTFGAVGDSVERSNGVVTGTALSSSGAVFTSADVGKVISIEAAGVGGNTVHTTTIAARVSATAVTLTSAVTTNIASNAFFTYGTDDTAAIQAAISYIATVGIGTLFFPVGHYIVNGDLQDTSYSKAQILLPYRTSASQMLPLRFLGATPPATCNDSPGVIIHSTRNVAGQMFGRKGTTGTGTNWLNFLSDGIVYRTPGNSQTSAFSAGYLRLYEFRNGRCDVPNSARGTDPANFYLTAIKPTNSVGTADTGDVGIRCAFNNVSTRGFFYNFAIIGYYYGMVIGELVGGSVQIGACRQAIAVTTGSHPTDPLAVLATNCTNYIGTDGGTLELNIILDIEHNTVAGSGPAWVEDGTWGVDQWDINDPGGDLTGHVHRHMHDVSIPWAQNGGNNLRVTSIPRASDGLGLGTLFTDFWTNGPDRSSLLEVRGRGSKQPWISFLHSQASTTGDLGPITWSNKASVGNDIRQAGIGAKCDGAINRGYLGFSTGRDDTFTLKWGIDSLGTLIATAMPRNAADDAAAAALTPAVPVGGVYRNGSVLMIRVA